MALNDAQRQVENDAEFGLEHNRLRTIGAVEASRLALLGDGSHRVSLDQVIETMRKTGLDMNVRYKETSLGGLAVNVVEC